MARHYLTGTASAVALLAVYFSITSFISGTDFAVEQFLDFWPYITSLAIGFGIQVGLYSFLRYAVSNSSGAGVLAVSGTTSTAAMVSCCAHYLVNILPIIGVSGIMAFIGQYQIQFFWFGIASNLAGIGYIANKIIKVRRTRNETS